MPQGEDRTTSLPGSERIGQLEGKLDTYAQKFDDYKLESAEKYNEAQRNRDKEVTELQSRLQSLESWRRTFWIVASIVGTIVLGLFYMIISAALAP